MNVLEDSSYLLQSAVICLLASHLFFWNYACSGLEILFVLNQSKVSLVHLSAHVLEVFKDAYLVLLILPIKEGLIGVQVVLQPLLRCLGSVHGRWITSQETLSSVELFIDFIMMLQLKLALERRGVVARTTDTLKQGVQKW